MGQLDLTYWVKKKQARKQPQSVFLFLQDIPRILDENLNEYGPFKRGDLIPDNFMPMVIFKVLQSHGVVWRFWIRDKGVKR